MTDDVRHSIVEPAAKDARDDGGHRAIWLGVAGALICFLVLGAITVWQSATLHSQLDDQSAAVTQQHQAAQALEDQVRDLGGTPTTQVPPVTGMQGPQGATGEQGPAGPPGPTGPTGPTGPSGAVGPSGASGADGAEGSNGADGSAGAAGPAGPQGEPGPAGPPGPACPDGYTLGPAIILSPDGSTHQGLACMQNAPPSTSSSPAHRIGR